jgi:hypothetical protein
MSSEQLNATENLSEQQQVSDTKRKFEHMECESEDVKTLKLDEILNLKEQLKNSEQQRDELEQRFLVKIDDYKHQNCVLKSKLEETKSQLEAKKTSVTNLAALERENTQLLVDITQLKEKLSIYELSKDKVLANLEKEKQNLKNLNKNLLEKISGMTKDLAENKARIASLESENKSLLERSNLIESLESRVAELSSQSEAYLSEKNNWTVRFDELNHQLTESLNANKQLRNELASEKSSVALLAQQVNGLSEKCQTW